jgi:thiol:disulfide interchange protein DsbD
MKQHTFLRLLGILIAGMFGSFLGNVGMAWGQILEPAKWDVRLAPSKAEGKTDLVFHVKLDAGWHVYSQFLPSDEGPLPTVFTLELPKGAKKEGEVVECPPISEFDPNFQMVLNFFDKEAYFVQTLDLSKATSGDSIRGGIEFMVCDESRCLPPEFIPFAVAVGPVSGEAVTSYCNTVEAAPVEGETQGGAEEEEAPAAVEDTEDPEKGGLWGIFLLGMALGFAALLTPCVFPMIPMTVSFFTKQSRSRGEGVRNAIIYGLFIILIYTGLGLILTAAFGIDILNVISTHPVFNVFLFVLLLIFGASFLGAFEIQLPSKWVNAADRGADRGGLLGIFFMAATLAIVSFSCTGPLVGSALAGAATGSYQAPATIMFGFSLALALPFMLFSAFPGWLNSLPQSGGWLNSVKVVLGLLEIGFAFKFLSNADLVLQLGLLPRELFIAIWIAVAFAIAFYLFGWLAFPHDSKFERMGVFRFAAGLSFFLFAIYLVPGLWGAPVKLISGFPPPLTYAEQVAGGGAHGGGASGHVTPRFTDYEDALAASAEEGKPVLIDFTGWACVNCRKMEEQVWPHPEVASILNDDVILVSLYVDEKIPLPESEQFEGQYKGKPFPVKTVGNKWTLLQAENFHTNSQPFYVMVDHEGNQVGGHVGYDSDPQLFLDFLAEGLAAYTEKGQSQTPTFQP